jgi:hypothetical protein
VQENRTQLEVLQRKMSDHRSTVFGAETIRNFQLWRKAFARLRKNGLADREFSEALKDGCVNEDLEWGLFNIPFRYEFSGEGNSQGKVFFGTLDKVLSDLSRLDASFTSLVNLRYRSGSYLGACLSHLRSGNDELFAIYTLLASLDELEKRFRVIRELGRSRRRRSATASEPEALLFLYVKKFTGGKCSFDHVSVLMRAAFEAYGIEARSYDIEAFERRYNRFKKQSPHVITLINHVLDRYQNLKPSARSMGVIDYFYEAQLALGRKLTDERLKRQGQIARSSPR